MLMTMVRNTVLQSLQTSNSKPHRQNNKCLIRTPHARSKPSDGVHAAADVIPIYRGAESVSTHPARCKVVAIARQV